MEQTKYFRHVIILGVSLFFTFIFIACNRCKCTCDFCSGCSTLSAHLKENDSLIVKKRFCTNLNMLTDEAFIDSCKQFNQKYASNYHIKQVDSTFNCDKKVNITCEASEKLPEYLCRCAK